MRVFATVLIELLFLVSATNEESGDDDQGIFACNKLPDTDFTYNLTVDDSVILTCPKECRTKDRCLWYHAFTTSVTNLLPMAHQHCVLPLTVTYPPRTTDLGYFCCACAGEHRKESCCFGVALHPKVISFTVTQDGEPVKGVHVGANITLSCEACAYPSITVEILKDGEKVDGEEKDGESWYSCRKSLKVSSVTEEHSGVFTCKASITLQQDGQSLTAVSQKSQELVVYEKLEVIKTQLNYSGSPVDGELTFVCLVNSSIENYTVSWLFNNDPVTVDDSIKVESEDGGEYRLTLKRVTRDDEGIYTCVVSTPYQGEEARGTTSFKLPDPSPYGTGGRPQPHNVNKSYGGFTFIAKALLLMVIVIVAFIVMVVAFVCYMILRRHRKGAPVSMLGRRTSTEGEHEPLQEAPEEDTERSEDEDQAPVREFSDQLPSSEGSETETDGVGIKLISKGLRHRIT